MNGDDVRVVQRSGCPSFMKETAAVVFAVGPVGGHVIVESGSDVECPA